VVRDDPVDLLDVAPILLSLAGLEPPPSMRGRALLGGERPRPRPLEAFLAPDRRFEEAVQPRVQRRAVTRWPWKLIVDRDGQARAYQLDRDPEELEPHAITSDLPSWLPATAAQIRQALESARDVLGDAPIDPDELERLRALGYAR
jgi:arylsulfatase A-like enzyme